MKNVTLIIGKAGCGKSFYLGDLINKTYMQTNNFIVIAFTHSAVDTIRNKCNSQIPMNKFKTFHSFFQIDWKQNIINFNNKHKYDYIFIDEFSLIDKKLFKQCLLRLNLNTKIIISGDIFQLPCININKTYISYKKLLKYFDKLSDKNYINNDIIRVIKHYENSILSLKCLKNSIRITLKENKRSNKDILNMIEKCFDNKIYVDYKFITFDSIRNKILNENYVFISSTYKQLQKIHILIRDNYDFSLKQNISYSYGLKELRLKIGEWIYTTTNTDNYHNGELLQIVNYINDKIICVDILNQQKIIEQISINECYENSPLYYPILPEYLLTIHKSQGKTILNVILSIDNLFEFTMLYTGISRASNNILFYSEKNNVVPDFSNYMNILEKMML